MRPIHGLTLAVCAAALVALWRAAARAAAVPRARRTGEPRVDPDCEVSECGPDGVPLSSYAG